MLCQCAILGGKRTVEELYMSKTNEIRIDVLEMILVFVRGKKTVILTTALVIAAVAAYALLAVPEYTAEAVVIPKEDNIDVVSSFIKNMPMAKSQLKGNLFSPATDIENVYIALVKSTTLQLDVIKKFNLIDVYKFSKRKKYYIEDVLKLYSKRVSCGLTDEGMLDIAVRDESPKRAADMANYITATMDDMYGNLAAEAARSRRIFLDERLKLIRRDMAACEDSLTQFQMKNRIADVEQQAKATIDAGATVEAKLLAEELELNIAKKTFTPDNEKIKEMEMNLAEMKKQRDALTDVRETSLLLPLKIAPQVAIQFFRFKRDLKIQEMLFELVMQQYEAAKLEEAKNTPHIQILDKADAPQKRSKPKRTRLVMTAFFISLLLNFIFLNIAEMFQKMRRDNSESYRKIVLILRTLLAFKR